MILQVNKVKKENRKSDFHATYEDYIEIGSIQKNEYGFMAKSSLGPIFLSHTHEFEEIYKTLKGLVEVTKRDDYNMNNLGFFIQSVYLLDDTGKTIKKLM